jgi:hypothetical protein
MKDIAVPELRVDRLLVAERDGASVTFGGKMMAPALLRLECQCQARG